MNTIKWYALPDNTQELKTDQLEIEVVKGKWMEPYPGVLKNGRMAKQPNPILFIERKMNFEDPYKEEYVYYLNMQKDGKGIDCFIKLDYWQNQQFLWNQRKHWLQDRDFVKFIIPTMISMISLFVAYLAYKK